MTLRIYRTRFQYTRALHPSVFSALSHSQAQLLLIPLPLVQLLLRLNLQTSVGGDTGGGQSAGLCGVREKVFRALKTCNQSLYFQPLQPSEELEPLISESSWLCKLAYFFYKLTNTKAATPPFPTSPSFLHVHLGLGFLWSVLHTSPLLSVFFGVDVIFNSLSVIVVEFQE